MLFCSKNY